jgi:hypothetical protein
MRCNKLSRLNTYRQHDGLFAGPSRGVNPGNPKLHAGRAGAAIDFCLEAVK